MRFALLKHPGLIAIAAAALAMPALWVGLQFDDYLLEQQIQGASGLDEVTAELFRLHPGDSETTAHLMEQGVLPWWTYPDMRVAFWRPISAITHWLDHRLWPDSPVRMHAHSLVWFALLIAVIAVLYRTLMPTTGTVRSRVLAPCFLAAWLYALDDAHGFAVGWIANRNILLATLFGSASLLTYSKWRRDGWRPGAWLTPLLLLLGLLSAESAVAILSYFFAYALFLDDASRRWIALTPSLLIVVGWQVVYRHQGYGVTGTAYSDPLHNPGRYLFDLLERAPVLLLGQLALPPAEFHNLLSGPGRIASWTIAVVVVVVVLRMVCRPTPIGVQRSSSLDTRLTRFWMVGMLGALLPASVILPAGRMLFFTGLGAMGLISQFLANHTFDKSTSCGRATRILGGVLVAIHLVAAPLSLPLNSYGPKLLGNLEPAARGLPVDESKVIVIVAAPSAFHTGLIPYLRERGGQSIPRTVRVLATTLRTVEVERIDSQTVAVRPAGGFLLGLESLFRSRDHALERNERIQLPDATIEVTELTPEGNPAEVRFRFTVPLSDASLAWFYWRRGEYAHFTLPEPGEAVTLALW